MLRTVPTCAATVALLALCMCGPKDAPPTAVPGGDAPPPAPDPKDCDTGPACHDAAASALGGGDHGLAAELFGKSCDMKHVDGCKQLGSLYLRGEGMDKDLVKAGEAFGKGCEAGDAASCTNHGSVLFEDESGRAQALPMFAKGCETGDARGCALAGTMLERGIGVKADPPQAIALYRKACDGGDAAGCANAGIILAKQAKPDWEAVTGLLRVACDKKQPAGCHNLGVLALQGKGMGRDPVLAASALDVACKGGEKEACPLAKEAASTAKRAIPEANVTVAAVTVGKFTVEDLSCKVDKAGGKVASKVASALSKQRRALDKCASAGGAASVRFSFAKGKVTDAKASEAGDPKIEACVAQAVQKAKPKGSGECSAVVLMGKSGPAKAAATKIRTGG